MIFFENTWRRMLAPVARKVIRNYRKKKPDEVIRGSDGVTYLFRWKVLPRNRFFNLYIHNFLSSDDDRALHDHPWPSLSVILDGAYFEHVPAHPKLWPDDQSLKVLCRLPGDVVFRRPSQAHRISLLNYGGDNPLPCWTLFFVGPRVRSWGFQCGETWVPWKVFDKKGGCPD